MKKNENLHKAKTEKNDEFYTLLSDIEKEVEHYKDHFEGKTVYCNCDDCYESNFFKFFMMNFERFGIKRLITTCYKSSNVSGNEINLFNDNQEVAHGYKIDISNFEHKEDRDIWQEIEETTKENATLLEGDGDFRSGECLKLLQEADIVVTNPPFSLFREFIDVVVKYDKKFLVIGNMNAITYKEIFPLIKDNKLWLGYNYVKSFMQPNGEIKHFGNILWFTNLNHKKRNEELILYKEYNEKEYPKYDNYNAINVNKVTDIPKDYNGVMGVPITFLDKYNPNQFEIVSFRKGKDGKDLVFTIDGEREFNITFVSLYDIDCRNDKKQRRESEWENYLCSNNDKKKVSQPIDYFYPISTNLKNGMINDYTISGKKGYCRMLIRKRRIEL